MILGSAQALAMKVTERRLRHHALGRYVNTYTASLWGRRLVRELRLARERTAAHATLLTPREIRLLADTGAAISYNPVASSWKGNAVAPALLLHELGARLGLGTDKEYPRSTGPTPAELGFGG